MDINKMTNIAFFRQSDFWRDFEDSWLKRIGPLCAGRSYDPGTEIFEEGEEAHYLYILKEGNVALVVKTESREEVIVGTIINAGEIFGWSSLVEPYIMTASAICLAKTSLYIVQRKPIEALFLKEPLFGFHFMKKLAALTSKRLRDTRAQLFNYIS